MLFFYKGNSLRAMNHHSSILRVNLTNVALARITARTMKVWVYFLVNKYNLFSTFNSSPNIFLLSIPRIYYLCTFVKFRFN